MLIYRKKLISSLPEELIKKNVKNKRSARMAACASCPGSCGPYKGYAGKGFCRANTLQSCARGADSRASLEKEE